MSLARPVSTGRTVAIPSFTTKTTLRSGSRRGLRPGAPWAGGGGAASPGFPPARSFSVRTVTAWIGTTTASSRVSVAMEACALMPGSAPATGAVSASRTMKVVTSASVPAFLTVALRATSTTWAGNLRSGKASISTSAGSPSFT